jgi:hypothetical protein
LELFGDAVAGTKAMHICGDIAIDIVEQPFAGLRAEAGMLYP